jgi:hypothetical protein
MRIRALVAVSSFSTQCRGFGYALSGSCIHPSILGREADSPSVDLPT